MVLMKSILWHLWTGLKGNWGIKTHPCFYIIILMTLWKKSLVQSLVVLQSFLMKLWSYKVLNLVLVTPYSGSPIVGAWGVLPPYPMILKTPPIKTDAPHGAPPHLKMNPLPSEKHPHWNMKHLSMKWFLEKAQ